MTSYQIVDAPAKMSARDGLLRTFPAENPAVQWHGGLQFDPEGCGYGGLVPADCNDVDLDDKNVGCCDGDGDSEVKARPYTLYSAYEVSTFNDRGLATEKARDAYNRCHDKILETEFWTGQAAKVAAAAPINAVDLPLYLADIVDPARAWNPMFPTGTDTADWATSIALSPMEALAQAMEVATGGCNGKGVIHVPQSALNYWVTLNLVERDGNRWVTKVGGHIVVPGRGYPGTAPDGSVVDGLAWIYVTGMVNNYLGNADSRWVDNEATHLTHRQNRNLHIVEQQAVAVFDPCVWAGIPMYLCLSGCSEIDVTSGTDPGFLNNEYLLEGSVSGITYGA